MPKRLLIIAVLTLLFISHPISFRDNPTQHQSNLVSICVRTQIFLTARKDTVQATGINQIPTVLVKAKPAVAAAAAVNLKVPVKVPMPVKVPVPVPVKVPILTRPIPVTNPKTPYEVNKLFNEMKNSKKPFMTIQMKAPAKQSIFPDPFSLFDDDNRYCHLLVCSVAALTFARHLSFLCVTPVFLNSFCFSIKLSHGQTAHLKKM